MQIFLGVVDLLARSGGMSWEIYLRDDGKWRAFEQQWSYESRGLRDGGQDYLEEDANELLRRLSWWAHPDPKSKWNRETPTIHHNKYLPILERRLDNVRVLGYFRD